MKRLNQSVRSLSIGLGIILNQLKNYFKRWFGKSHLSFILKEKIYELLKHLFRNFHEFRFLNFFKYIIVIETLFISFNIKILSFLVGGENFQKKFLKFQDIG